MRGHTMNKNQKLLKNLSIYLIIGILTSIVSHIIIEVFHFNYDIAYVMEQNFNARPMIFLYGVIILFLFYIFFTSLTGSSVIGSILLVLLSLITGVATNLKNMHRAEPLYPNEIS